MPNVPEKGFASEKTLEDVLAKLTTGNGLLGPFTPVGSVALETSHVISAAPCTLRRATGTNPTAADLWLFVLDAVALPGDGALPAPGTTPVLVPAGTANGDEWPGGIAMATGCVLAFSSTLASLTHVGATCLYSAVKS